MKRAGVDVTGGSSLRECVFEDEFESLARLVKTRSRSASSPSFDLPVKAVDENRECGQQQSIHRPDMRYVPVNLARRTGGVHL
jgi:hypothetical protein